MGNDHYASVSALVQFEDPLFEIAGRLCVGLESRSEQLVAGVPEPIRKYQLVFLK